jgi:glucokinase
VNEAAQKLIGVDVGGTKTAVVLGIQEQRSASLGAPSIEVQERIAFGTPPGPENTIARIVEALGTLESRRGIRDAAAFGVSCGGPLDSATGTVLSPPNLPGWDRVPIVSTLERELGIPGSLQNDANACALAEWLYGAGRLTRNMAFLTFGTGMGAGLILNGALYEGREGMAGEVGHIRLAENGPEGYGKRGSFEGFCSGGGIARLAQEKARELLARGTPPALLRTEERIAAITARDICEAARAGDAFAREVCLTSGRFLGQGLSILIDVLNPERIVIGGVFARAHDLLLPPALEVVAQEALGISRGHCEIVPAGLGEAIGDFAALSVAAYHLAKRGASV